jgi:hypothetical protein
MTLTDIARMLKYAKVPRSKTVEVLYPKPCIQIYVPAQFIATIRAVVSQMALPHQPVSVDVLNTLDVRQNEHVLFKIKGATAPHVADWSNDATMPTAELRRQRIKSARIRNADVVIDFARVAS